jgi:Protein of unknown function (DUF3604)
MAWVDARAKWEPHYEITQPKGTGEQHPTLARNDEFANFAIWDKGNLNLHPKKPGMIKTEYAREALKNGLAIEKKLGVNPFKFGLAGPVLLLLDPQERNRWPELHLRLGVNGQVRQDACCSETLHEPDRTLTDFTCNPMT